MMSAAEDGSEPLGASRVGAELKAARLRLGWRLPDVASGLRIRLPYLEAIEAGRLTDLPGNAYAMGFLRSYATTLGLDAAEVARRFRAEAQEVNRRPELAFPAPVPERGVPAGAVVLLGVVIAAGSYAAWYKFSGDRQAPAVTVPAVPERLAPLAERAAPPSNPSPQVASMVPPPSAGALPEVAGGAVRGPAAGSGPVGGGGAVAGGAPVAGGGPAAGGGNAGAGVAVAGGGAVVGGVPAGVGAVAGPRSPPGDAARVVLRFKADSWVQVREKQGAVLLNRVMRAGESWPVPKGEPLLLTTGNALGTEVVVDGTALPPLGTAGVVRRDVPLDADPPAASARHSTARPAPQ